MSRTTPNIGLVIPQATDTPDVPYWLGKLADRLDPLLGSWDDMNAITASTGWTLGAGQVFVRRGMCHIYLNITRTGAAISAGTTGNITNVEVATMSDTRYFPIAPVGGSNSATGGMAAIGLWTNGGFSISAIPPGVNINTNDAFSASFIYPLPLPALA